MSQLGRARRGLAVGRPDGRRSERVWGGDGGARQAAQRRARAGAAQPRRGLGREGRRAAPPAVVRPQLCPPRLTRARRGSARAPEPSRARKRSAGQVLSQARCRICTSDRDLGPDPARVGQHRVSCWSTTPSPLKGHCAVGSRTSDAERVQVSSAVDLATQDLLGRHVLGCLGPLRASSPVSITFRIQSPSASPCRPRSSMFDGFRRIESHVLAVRGGQRVADLAPDLARAWAAAAVSLEPRAHDCARAS